VVRNGIVKREILHRTRKSVLQRMITKHEQKTATGCEKNIERPGKKWVGVRYRPWIYSAVKKD
jgi:hypothetical protein